MCNKNTEAPSTERGSSVFLHMIWVRCLWSIASLYFVPILALWGNLCPYLLPLTVSQLVSQSNNLGFYPLSCFTRPVCREKLQPTPEEVQLVKEVSICSSGALDFRREALSFDIFRCHLNLSDRFPRSPFPEPWRFCFSQRKVHSPHLVEKKRSANVAADKPTASTLPTVYLYRSVRIWLTMFIFSSVILLRQEMYGFTIY